MAPGSAARSRASLVAAQAMPIIAEDDSVAPALPKRSASRRSSKPIPHAAAYNYNYYPFSSRSPTTTIPTTSSSSDGSFPDRKPEHNDSQALHHQEWVARRGGWYRMLIITLVIIALIVGLAVGLTHGLRKKNSSSSSTTLPNVFPAGNYTFTTALSSLSTSCSSSPKTWRCYPYALYSPASASSNASSATFFWTIVPRTSWSYTISSTANPFAPSFDDLPMTLVDPNQYTERLTFNFTLAHSSIVDGALVPGSTATTTCWFNSTVMAVTLWTRMRAEFPPGIESASVPVNGTGDDGAFATWPFRVQVTQTQLGGQGVPDCRDPAEGKVGGDLGAGGECGCFYSNFGLGNGTANATASGTASGTVSGAASTTASAGASSAASGRVTRT